MIRGWTNLSNHSDFDVTESLGYLPMLVSPDDPRSIKDQIAANYSHGGGYSPYGEGKWVLDGRGSLRYPEDPPLQPICKLQVRDEIMYFYQHAICCIVQPDGSFAVVRMD